MNARDQNATEAQLKREIIQALEALRARQFCYSFRIVNARLKLAKLPTAQGWVPLIEKFQHMAVSRERLIECRDAVMEIYMDSLKFGTRAVSEFEVSKSEAEKAAKKIHNLVQEQSEFAQKFPFQLAPSKLQKAAYNGTFCHSVEEADGVVRIFACCKRAYRTRESIDLNELGANARSELDGYEEVFGVRSGFVQGFDSIVIRPKSGVVEIHLDIICRLTREDFSQARNFYTDRIN